MVNTSSRSPMVYMTLGNPGAGKTFFARQFAQSVSVPFISMDRLRHELYDEPNFTPEEDRTVLGVADYMTEQFLSAGLSVILDGLNHTRTRRHFLRQLARQNGAQPLIVWVQTDDDTCFDRATSRDRRNQDDKYAREMREDEFDSFLPKIKAPQHEDYVVISGKHVYKNQLNAVSSKVTNMFNNPKTVERPMPTMQRRRPSTRRGRISG